MAPIFRFMRWLEHRKTLCRLCRKHSAMPGLEGYCSASCGEHDAEMQAHG